MSTVLEIDMYTMFIVENNRKYPLHMYRYRALTQKIKQGYVSNVFRSSWRFNFLERKYLLKTRENKIGFAQESVWAENLNIQDIPQYTDLI